VCLKKMNFLTIKFFFISVGQICVMCNGAILRGRYDQHRILLQSFCSISLLTADDIKGV